LGYNLTQNYTHCWKCGWKPVSRILAKILNVPEGKAYDLIKLYGGIKNRRKAPEPTIKIRLKNHKLPSGTEPLTARHKQYLESRLFDPDKLEKEWKLVGTGPIALLDKVDYKHRIIAPITWDGEEVSFQGRDITNKHELRYITCPKERELIFHKHILYANQEKWTDVGICTEGITDVWRLGPRAFATFGIEFTAQQVRVIAKSFKRVAVVFDDEPQAKEQADKMVDRLQFRNIDAWRVDIIGDPGSMKQEDADYLIKQLR
jgi:hypothetical protein